MSAAPRGQDRPSPLAGEAGPRSGAGEGETSLAVETRRGEGPDLRGDGFDAPAPPLAAGPARHEPVAEAEAAALVLRYQAGESDALDLLHQRLEPAILSLLRRYRSGPLPPSLTQQDLRQQSWIVLAELARRWRPRGSFLAYFFRSFPGAISRYVRRAQPAARAALAESAPVYDAGDSDRGTSLEEELAALDELDREILLLRSLDFLNMDDIARLLGVPRSTAYRHYRRARSLLGRPQGPDPEPTPPMLRLVRALHALAHADGRLPGRDRVLAASGLSRTQFYQLMAEFEAGGAISGRGPRAAGRLVERDVAATPPFRSTL